MNTDLLHLARFTYYDRYTERAAIKEYDAGMDRTQAEEEAFREVLAEFKGIIWKLQKRRLNWQCI